MKELFTGLLSVSLSGSLIIGIVLLLRLAFKKAPKALICLLWGGCDPQITAAISG